MQKIDLSFLESIYFFYNKSYSKGQESLKKDRIKTLINVKTIQFCYHNYTCKKLGRTEKKFAIG